MIDLLFPHISRDWETEPRGPRPRQAPAVLTERVVTVGRTNGHGFQSTNLDWLNWSRFAKSNEVIMPRVGDTVTVFLDNAGFIRRLGPAERLQPPQPPIAVEPIVEAPAEAEELAPIAPAEERESVVLCGRIEQDDRSRIITRLACVKAAAEASAGMPTEDILAQAGAFEAWVLR